MKPHRLFVHALRVALMLVMFTLNDVTGQPVIRSPLIRLLDAAQTNDVVRGEARLLRFNLGSFPRIGSLEIEVSSNLADVNAWSTLATFPVVTLGDALNPEQLVFAPANPPGAVFFRAVQRTETTVRHSASGRVPRVFNGLSYDVDASQSFDLAYAKYRIENAADLARSNNIPFTTPPMEAPILGRLTRFHFWPNVFDLTEIFYADEDLYERIVSEILEFEPEATAMAASWRERVLQSERIILARDFLSVAQSGGLSFEEVHYAFAINLDAKTVRELQVHGRESEGLGNLHDPLIDDLRDRLARAATLPLGETWQMCLRGNLRRSHFQAVIVDKIEEAPRPEFHVVRIHQTCGGSLGPPPPEEPPYLAIPVPGEKPPPPGGGPKPPGKGPGAAGPPGLKEDQDPPVRPWPWAEKEYEEPPRGPEEPSQRGLGPQNFQQEAPKIQMLLEQFQQMAQQIRPQLEADLQRFRAMSYEWIDGVRFNNPCVQQLYDRYAAQVAQLRQQMAALLTQAGQSSAAAQSARRNASPAVRAILFKEGLWENMITVGGEWSRVQVPCMPPAIPSAGFADGVFNAVVITGEQFAAFHNDLVKSMMNGKSWREAVEAALANPKHYPPNVVTGDLVYKLIWARVAECYRELFTRMFRIYLRGVFPGLTEAQREEMIPVLFDCDQNFTTAQRAEWGGILDQLAGDRTNGTELLEQAQKLENQIKDILSRFRNEANACFNDAIRHLREIETRVQILRAALVEALTPGASGSLPPKGFNFCGVLQQLINAPPVQDCPGLRAYLMMLFRENCQPPGGGGS